MNINPVTLEGPIVRLVPLELEQASELTTAGQDATIWKYMRYGVIDSEEKMRKFISDLLAHQARGTDLPFTVLLAQSGKAIGMTRYLNIDLDNRAVEIGGTWYAPEYQHTGVNTESKFLLLQFAFETLNVIRVQFKADQRNERSQRAIERIGAIREGVLRDHMIMLDGTFRSSVYYSILAREWPEVKQRLIGMMARQ
jgi:N-acetyltransferase